MNILAIDQGTSSTKAAVVDGDGTIVALTEVPVASSTGPHGAVEQDPTALWDSVINAGREAIRQSRVRVDAVGLANQGETVLAWDARTGEALTPAISWQDRRALSVTSRLRAHEERLRELTGLSLDPYFSAPKMTWLRESVPSDAVVGTTDAWLTRKLIGTSLTDASTASRSMIMELSTRTWSEEACDIFELPLERMAKIVDTAGAFGETSAFGPSIALTGLMVDQQAALVGENCLDQGEAKCTFGTGAFFLMNVGTTPRRSTSGLSTSVAWQLPSSFAYCLDGQVYTAGAAITWLVQMGLLARGEDVDEVACQVRDTDGVVVVPSLAGLGAPYWNPTATGALEGLTLNTRPAHVVRATLMGLAMQVTLMALDAAHELGQPLRVLRVDGGLTKSRVLMQYQADLLQVPVEVFESPNATALGIARMARCGAFDTPLVSSHSRPGLRYEPAISLDEAQSLRTRFERSAQRVLDVSSER
jgi:glycerol kinase